MRSTEPSCERSQVGNQCVSQTGAQRLIRSSADFGEQYFLHVFLVPQLCVELRYWYKSLLRNRGYDVARLIHGIAQQLKNC